MGYVLVFIGLVCSVFCRELSQTVSIQDSSLFQSISTEPYDGKWEKTNTTGCSPSFQQLESFVYALTRSEILQITALGFTIPYETQITNISLSFHVQSSQQTDLQEYSIGIFKDSNKSMRYSTRIAESRPWTVEGNTIVYPLPGEDGTWDTIWTPDDINSASFGVFLRIQNGEVDAVGIVQCINVTVVYIDNDNQEEITAPQADPHVVIAVLVLVFGVCILLAGCLIIVFIYMYNERKKDTERKLLVKQSFGEERSGIFQDFDEKIEEPKGMAEWFFGLFRKKEEEFVFPAVELKPITTNYIETLTLDIKLSNGRYGEIWTGLYQSKIPNVVCKFSIDEDPTSAITKRMEKEIDIHKTLHHHNIVQFIGIHLRSQQFSRIEQPLLVTEYAKLGPVKNYLKSHRNVGWNVMLQIGSQISSALSYLHCNGILHRDVCAKNILMMDKNTAKLCDFGMAVRNDVFKDLLSSNFAVRWASPETLKEGDYSKHTDAWSFGVALWEIFNYGEDPWENKKDQEIIELTLSGKTLTCHESIEEIPPLLEKIFRLSPEERLSCREINLQLRDIKTKHFGRTLEEEEQCYSIAPNNLVYDLND